MNFRTAFAAAFLAASLATGAVAEEKVDNGGFDGRLNDWGFSSLVNQGLSNSNNVGVVDTNLFPTANAIWQVVSLEVGRYLFSFDGIFSGGKGSGLVASIFDSRLGQVLQESFKGSAINGSKSYEFDVAKAGNFTLFFLGDAVGRNGYIAVDNVSITPVVAVPGPEAGAGLAGLAMAGMYVWASRRRKTQAAA